MTEDTAAQARAANAAAGAAVSAFPARFCPVGTFPRADGTGEARLHAAEGRGVAPPDPAAALRRLTPAPAS